MTVRTEILRAMRILEGKHGGDTFQLKVNRQQVLSQDSTLNISSIKTHIVPAMCVNAPKNHAIPYQDLVRVGHGMYRLNSSIVNQNQLLMVNIAMHKLIMKQPSKQILNRDVKFIIRTESKKLGELHISKGATE